MSTVITLPLFSENRFTLLFKRIITSFQPNKSIDKLQEANVILKNQLLEEEGRVLFWEAMHVGLNSRQDYLLQQMDTLKRQLDAYKRENYRLNTRLQYQVKL